ncbi:hypothetical protein K7W42_02380 [Deinococcus sp. HMF7604]|uniref:hypothetical protein n=1 Tax=Deinococcus betulae TaxID=2873312 RepID=UPI001CCE02FA|nr:hypothetical protein [Deinococcus betulae]MBZ9749705.1 hypothetical protein [Deinococcus betulae]
MLGLLGLVLGGLLTLPGLGLGFLLLAGGGPEALDDAPDVSPGLLLMQGGFWLCVLGVICLVVSPWRDPKGPPHP